MKGDRTQGGGCTSGYVHYCVSPALMRRSQSLRGSLHQIRFLIRMISVLFAFGNAFRKDSKEFDLVVVIHLRDFGAKSKPLSAEELKRILVTRCVQKV